MTSRLGTGKWKTFFYSVYSTPAANYKLIHRLYCIRGSRPDSDLHTTALHLLLNMEHLQDSGIFQEPKTCRNKKPEQKT